MLCTFQPAFKVAAERGLGRDVLHHVRGAKTEPALSVEDAPLVREEQIHRSKQFWAKDKTQ